MIASNQPELNRICTLQYGAESGKPAVLVPEQTFFHQNFGTINFNFMQHAQIVQGIYDNKGSDEACFTLVCQSEHGKALKEIIPLAGIESYKYCVRQQRSKAISSIS